MKALRKAFAKTITLLAASVVIPSHAAIVSGSGSQQKSSPLVTHIVNGNQAFVGGMSWNSIFTHNVEDSYFGSVDLEVVVGYQGLGSSSAASQAGENSDAAVFSLEHTLTPFTDINGFPSWFFSRWLGWATAGQTIDGTLSSNPSGNFGLAQWNYVGGNWIVESDFDTNGASLIAGFALMDQLCNTNSGCVSWTNFGWVEFSVAAGNTHTDPFTVNVTRWAYEDTGASIIAGSTGAVSAVPEPASAVLMLAGLAGCWGGRRRMARRTRPSA